MSFLRPASPNPLHRASSPMDGSPMDFSSPPAMNPSGSVSYAAMNPLSRVAQSPTAAHLRNRARRPSSLSIALDRTKSFTGFPSPSNISGGGSSTSSSLGGNGNGSGSILQPAATIQDYGTGDVMGRGRASSSASSMSIGLSPARRSTSLDEVALEETPNARRQTGFAMQVAKIKRHRQILGMSGLNGSESDLSITSNGQTTPDLVNQRGLEDDVDALAVDPDHNVHSSPMKESTPAKSTTSPVSPFALKGPLKPARLLHVQNELNAPFLDSETMSEAAFSRLIHSTSDLASRLRLTISNAGPSPARKRQTRNWMGEWAASNATGEPKHWAGRFPETVEGDGELPSPDTESDGSDQAGETTFVASRPSSVMGQAPIGIPIGGRSRSGSTVTANGDMMLIGSYGGNEQGETLAGMMDLDMASNMSSPVSTPLTTNWRDPAPMFQSKKRKLTTDQDKFDYQPQAKKRKGLSPYGTPMSLQAGTSSPLSNSASGSFVFPPPKSPLHLNGASLQLSMTAMPHTSSLSSLGFPNGSNNGLHQHRKSGSISMTWSRPGSAHSSPLLRPTSSHSNMPAPPSGMLLGPTLLSNSTTATPSENGDGGFNFTFSSTNGRNMAGATIHNPSAGANYDGGSSHMSQGGVVPPSFPSYTPGAQLGQYGAPVTSSPSARPMLKLPARALGANGAGFGFGAMSQPPPHGAGSQPRLDGGVVGLSLNP